MKKYTEFDELGDWCKKYESQGTELKVGKNHILFARLDGRAFHTFCRNLEKPFDTDFYDSMALTARDLISTFHADIAYTQSDEITLMWTLKKKDSEYPFDGKHYKLCSLLAAQCSMTFKEAMDSSREPLFDCRVWGVPSKEQALNVFTWRAWDCTRNSINSLASSEFPHSRLEGMGTAERLELLKSERNIDWNNLESRYKFGTFVTYETVLEKLSDEELSRIPLKHRPIDPVERKRYRFKSINIGHKDFDLESFLFPNEIYNGKFQ